MIETTSRYFLERVRFLEEERTRLQVELFEARFTANMERAMKKQIWTFCMAMMIGTAVLITIFGAVLAATRS